MVNISGLSKKFSLRALFTKIQRSSDYLLVVLFNVGCSKSRKETIPLSKEAWDKFPNLNVIAVHLQDGNRDFLPGQVLSVVNENETPYSVYLSDETPQKYWQRFPQWILFGPDGRKLTSIPLDAPSPIQELEKYLKQLPESNKDEKD